MSAPLGRRHSTRRSQRRRTISPRDWVAIILAVGIATSVNFITLAVMYDAIRAGSQLSENATQILVAAFGGIIGILGSYIGFRAGAESREKAQADEEAKEPPP